MMIKTQELFLTGLASQIDEIVTNVKESNIEVKEQLNEIKEKNVVLETELKRTRKEVIDMKVALNKSNGFNTVIENDSEAMLRNISDRCNKLEDIAQKWSEKKEAEKKEEEKKTEVKGSKAVVGNEQRKRPASANHRITWVLDKKKVEDDLNVELTAVKAYCVKEEGRFPKSNFEATVPSIVRKGCVDTLVMETGSIEITNMDVNKAMMDSSKSIKEYEKEWFSKVEEVSKNLFKIAEDAVEADPNLNVVIV